MTTFEQEWSVFKTRDGILKYRDLGSYYILWKNDDDIVWKCELKKDDSAETAEFEDDYKTAADSNAKKYIARSPDDLPLYTSIKNFSWNSTSRVTHDYSDKRTWYYSSTALTDASCTDTGDQTTYDLPTGLICPYLISDRDLLGTTYDWVIKEDGSTVTNYTVDYANHQITFDSARSGTITCTGKQQNGSAYDLIPSSSKYWLVDYIEIQVSVDSTFNDTLIFELILNNISTSYNDVVVGKTTFNGARDLLNKSNYGNSFPKFGELTKEVVILPWNFVTGYKIYPSSVTVNPYKNEFNKLRCRMANNNIMSDCEVATATFYCYERAL